MKKFLSVLTLFLIFSFSSINTIFAQGFNSITTPDGVNLIAVGNSGKIYRSVNSGLNYTSFTLGTLNFNCVTSFGNDVWFSGQNGNTYKTLKTNAPINIYNVGSAATLNSIVFLNANVGFACGDNGGVYKTTNGGVNWSLSNSGIPSVKLNSISFRDTDNGTVVGNNGSTYTTTNGGTSWILQISGTTRNLLKVKYFNGNLVAVGEYGTLLKNNGSGWSSVATKINTDIRGLSGTDEENIHLCGGGGFIRNNRNGNNAFLNFEQNPMMAELVDVFYYDNDKGWAICSSNSVIIYTTNGGSNWNMPLSATVSYSWILKQSTTGNIGNPFCLHPQNRNGVFILAGSSLYRSLDKGNTWILLSSGIPGGSCHSFFVNALDTNIMIASKGSGSGRVIKSTNYGTNWFNVINPIILTSYGMPLEVDPNNPNTVYLAPDDDSLMKSTDFGISWTSLGGGEPGNIFRSPCDVVIQYDNPNTIFIGDGTTGMDFGKFWKSVDGGLNWTLINTTIGSEIPMIANTSLDLNLVLHTTWSSGSYWKSTNMGNNFLNLNQTGSLWATDIAKDDPTAICYDQYSINNAYISLNSGINFTSTNVTNSPAAGICFLDKSNLLIQHGGGVYKCIVTYTYNPPAGAFFTQMNITVAPEGFYNGLTLNMRDTLKVYLRNTSTPFTITDSAKAIIDSSTLTAACVFQNAPNGTYYIQIKHRNSLETWSKNGGETFIRGITSNYDFTSFSSQAYGNNEKLVGNKWCLYSGDVNGDGIIDAADISIVDNDVYNSVSGYIVSDVNGDFYADASDLSIVDNNAINSVIKITPESLNKKFTINKTRTIR